MSELPRVRRLARAPTPLPLIDIGLLRAIHYGILGRFGHAAAYEFWQAHPYQQAGHLLDPVEIARLIEDEDSRVPIDWASSVFNALEPFLNARDVNIEAFAPALLPFVNRGSFVTAKSILGALVPFLVRLARLRDPHRLMIRMFTLGVSHYVQGLMFEELLVKDSEAVLLIGFQAQWEKRFEPFEGQLFIARLFKDMPRSLGLHSFDAVEMLADPLPLSAANPALEERADAVYLGDEKLGWLLNFKAFCAARGLTLPAQVPNFRVAVMHADYRCPTRKRVILRAGCAYGSPVYLMRARWTPQHQRIHDVFQHLIAEAIEPDHLSHRDLGEQFIAKYERVIACLFDAADSSLYVNGELVCRGVPALIMRKCLLAHSAGRSVFTFREFKRDRELVSHPKNTGFEVRLARLRKALTTAACGLRLEPAGRGRFALHADARLSFEERPATAEKKADGVA